MTIDTEINLPPLPGALVDVETEARAYARAAVEADRQNNSMTIAHAWIRPALNLTEDAPYRFDFYAQKIADLTTDRQGRMPSDEEIYRMAEDARVWVPMGSGPEKERSLQALRSLITTALSRYSSSQPASVRCNHCGWHGADADLVRDVAADEPEDGAADVCPQCKRIGDLQDIGQPAANAEPTESAVLLDALSGLVKALRERHYGRMPDEAQAAYDKAWAIVFSSPVVAQAQPVINQQMTTAVDQSFVNMTPGTPAPVAQEPVAFLCRECDEECWSTYVVMPHEVPSTGEFLHVEPLYAAPVAAQVQAVVNKQLTTEPSAQDREDDEALADTQRAIIEAAERRGYARAEAENVGYRTDAGRYRFIRPGDKDVWCSSGDDLLTGDRLDAAIDADRAAKGADHG